MARPGSQAQRPGSAARREEESFRQNSVIFPATLSMVDLVTALGGQSPYLVERSAPDGSVRTLLDGLGWSFVANPDPLQHPLRPQRPARDAQAQEAARHHRQAPLVHARNAGADEIVQTRRLALRPRGALVLGDIDTHSREILNPPDDTVLEPGSALLYLAERPVLERP